MSSIDIANQTDKWMYELEIKAKEIGLNRREQKQYIKLEEIRDKYYEIYSKKFDKKHEYDCGNIGYCKQPKSCASRVFDKIKIGR
jgi:hypothetical protein